MDLDGVLRLDNNFEWFGVEIDRKVIHFYLFMADVQQNIVSDVLKLRLLSL